MNRPPLPLPPSTHWIDRDEALAEVLSELRAVREVALDTEADSYYVYFVKICLLQLSTRTTTYLIDPLRGLDLSPLGAMFADPGILKVVHAGSNDVGLLRELHGFEFRNVFDTMLSAQVLGLRRPGLASLMKERFGIDQKKMYQTSDWRRRPLSRGQLFYAVQDTQYLLPLKDQLLEELVAKGRLEEAREEFERLLTSAFTQRTLDPEAFLRAKGARELDPVGLRILSELFHYRDQLARRHDRSPHLVFMDRTLLEIAQKRPRTPEQLARIPGLTAAILARHQEALLGCVARGIEKGPLRRLRVRGLVSPEPPLNQRQRLLFERLREWRRARAVSRDVDESRIATTGTLRDIARRQPRTLEELAAVPGMTRYRVQEYGSEVLELLAAEPPAEE